MDTPIIISAISSIISCGALWVAYRSLVHSKKTRVEEKVLAARMKAIELDIKISEAKRLSKKLARKHPSEHDEEIHEAHNFFKENVKKLQEDLATNAKLITSQRVDEVVVVLHQLETQIDHEYNRLCEFLEQA